MFFVPIFCHIIFQDRGTMRPITVQVRNLDGILKRRLLQPSHTHTHTLSPFISVPCLNGGTCQSKTGLCSCPPISLNASGFSNDSNSGILPVLQIALNIYILHLKYTFYTRLSTLHLTLEKIVPAQISCALLISSPSLFVVVSTINGILLLWKMQRTFI